MAEPPCRQARVRARRWAWIAAASLLAVAGAASAHGVGDGDAAFVASNSGLAVGPFMYLGAKHMVTGYDHLLFLVGVVFFLHRLRDVVLYVTMFTLGHSATLLAGVLGGVHANPYVIDAVIGLSVVYKGFDNLGGFRRFLGAQPSTRAAVLVFGLFHGFGLATKVQGLSPSRDGLVGNILAFNVGVEIGQALALGAVVVAMAAWRSARGFGAHAFWANTALMAGGFTLVAHQVTGYLGGGL